MLTGEHGIDESLIRELAADVVRVLNRGTRWAGNDLGSRDLLRRMGQVLFDALLPAPIKAALRALESEARHVSLVVRADAALGFVPWELLHSGFGFLGLSFAIGRARVGDVPGDPAGRPGEHGPIGAPQRMLIVADPRGDLIGSYYEGLTLRDELGAPRPGANTRLRVDLRSSEVGRQDVLERVREYDIVHYAGHAEPSAPGEPRGWWLRDGVLEPSTIAALAGGDRFPRLVFVNACRSARESEAGEARHASLAAAFRDAGATHVIGTVWDVPDEPASGFAIGFYAALLAGASAGEAARQARLGLCARYGEDAIFWAAWVLHGDPDEVFFDAATRTGDRVTRMAPQDTAHLSASAPSIPAVAARVRGVAAAAAPLIVSLDDHRRGRLEALVQNLVMAACVAAVGVIAWGLGARAGEPIVARAVPSADFGPIEHLQALSLPPTPPVTAPARTTTSLPSSPTAARIELVASGAAVDELAPGQSFRLRWSVPGDGVVSIWRVESQGDIRRVLPAGPPGAVPVVAPVRAGTFELPGDGRSYLRDERPGTERFIVAWRAHAPLDEAALAREIARETEALAPAEAGLVRERFAEILQDWFDQVEIVDVVHR